MRPFISKRLEPYAFGFLLSGFMSLLVSGLATTMAIGFVAHFALAWVKAWLSSWLFAFPSVLIVAPMVRRILARIVIPAASEQRP